MVQRSLPRDRVQCRIVQQYVHTTITTTTTTTNSFASRVFDNTRHGTTSGFCRRESRNLTMERREYSVCVREAVIRVGNRRIMRCIRVWIGNERVSRATRWAMRQHMYDGKSGENGWAGFLNRDFFFFFRYWYWDILYVYGLYLLGYLVEEVWWWCAGLLMIGRIFNERWIWGI